MAKNTWITLPAAYEEFYGEPVSEVSKTASNQLDRFKKTVKELDFGFTVLPNRKWQIRKEDIQNWKDSHSSISAKKVA